MRDTFLFPFPILSAATSGNGTWDGYVGASLQQNFEKGRVASVFHGEVERGVSFAVSSPSSSSSSSSVTVATSSGFLTCTCSVVFVVVADSGVEDLIPEVGVSSRVVRLCVQVSQHPAVVVGRAAVQGDEADDIYLSLSVFITYLLNTLT